MTTDNSENELPFQEKENDLPLQESENDLPLQEQEPEPSEPVAQPLRLEKEMVATKPVAAGPRRPRLCLMGEFSAGKSTLSNFLIGASALPVNVTATQLPPVWISHGDETPFRVDLDGGEYDIDLNKLSEVSVDDTSHIRIFRDSPLLENCDLIDMPGISDPNMAPEVWQRVVHHADAVIWCTHATQAWRQSEAAVWSMMTPALYQKSFLLLTRMDKILSDRDRMRVIKRVGRETDGLFREIFPISLTKALSADDDPELLDECGAQAFTTALAELLSELNGDQEKAATSNALDARLRDAADMPVRNVMPQRIRPRRLATRTLTRKSQSSTLLEDPQRI